MKRFHWCIVGTLLFGLAVSTMGDGEFEVEKVAGKNTSSSELITDLVDFVFGYSSNSQARTFGVKRIQFMLMPMIFKMGVMMTMLVVLTVISLKGLMIGVTLLVLKLSAFFGKFYASLSTHHHGAWSPPGHPVHLHVHGDQHQPQYPQYPHYPQHYEPSPWETDNHPGDNSYYYKG